MKTSTLLTSVCAVALSGSAFAAFDVIPVASDYNASDNLQSTAPGSIDPVVFDTALGLAFDAGQGGVIQFQTLAGQPSQATRYFDPDTQTDGFQASYAGGSKILTVTSDIPVRRANFGSAGQLSEVNNFDFSDSDTGFAAGPDAGTMVLTFSGVEPIIAVALSATSRTTNTTIGMTVTYSDSSTASLSDVVTGGKNVDNTFFGFQAPTGLSIESLTVSRTDVTPWDDLAFITAPIPEPASLGLLGLGSLAMMGRRRRVS